VQTDFFAQDDRELVVVTNLVNALGPKEVAAHLRPDLDPDDGARWVNNCLNPSRREKFSYKDLIRMLIGARAKGHHDGMQELLRLVGYNPTTPKSATDEKRDLMQEVLAAQSAINQRFARMEEISKREKGEW